MSEFETEIETGNKEAGNKGLGNTETGPDDSAFDLLRNISSDIKRLMDRMPGQPAQETAEKTPFDLAQLFVSLVDLRERCLAADILVLGEPGWRIMLELYICGVTGRRVTVNDISVASGMPQTSSIRYIKMLVDRNYVSRHPSVTDKRVVHLALSANGRETMHEALKSMCEKLHNQAGA